MVDISLPIQLQKQHFLFWSRYLRCYLQKNSEISIFLIGNKKDSAADIQKTTEFFKELKKQKAIADWEIISAKLLQGTKGILKTIRNECSKFLERGESFMVPQLYKRVAGVIKDLRDRGVLMTGLSLHTIVVT